LCAWFVVISVPLAIATAKHQLAFRAPAEDGVTRLLQHLPPAEKRWRLVHLLGSGCPCSAKIARYLAERGPDRNSVEQVVLFGGSEHEKELRAAGFAVATLTGSEPAAFDTPGVPAFLILDERGELRHAGGYSARGRENAPQDLASLASLRTGGPATVHPIYGCTTRRNLKKLLDPLSREAGL
jgi:hypothetical protein